MSGSGLTAGRRQAGRKRGRRPLWLGRGEGASGTDGRRRNGSDRGERRRDGDGDSAGRDRGHGLLRLALAIETDSVSSSSSSGWGRYKLRSCTRNWSEKAPRAAASRSDRQPPESDIEWRLQIAQPLIPRIALYLVSGATWLVRPVCSSQTIHPTADLSPSQPHDHQHGRRASRCRRQGPAAPCLCARLRALVAGHLDLRLPAPLRLGPVRAPRRPCVHLCDHRRAAARLDCAAAAQGEVPALAGQVQPCDRGSSPLAPRNGS